MALADDTVRSAPDAGRKNRPACVRGTVRAEVPRSTGGRRRRKAAVAAKSQGSKANAGKTETRRSAKTRPGTATRRTRALDGLGGIAILAILGHSLGLPWLSGGYLGTVVLLVLASYLLTSTQLQRVRRGIGALPRLWAGLLRSIWPPLAMMSALAVIVFLVCDRELSYLVSQDVLPGLALVENVSYISRDLTPFGEGAASPLAHLWYLGVYAQFCLVWPLIMLLGYAALPSRTSMRRVTLTLALASAAGMALMYGDGAGATRAYFGADTRAFAPLLGAWLAYALPLGKRPARDVRGFVRGHRFALEIAGICAFVALVVGMAMLPGTSPILYRGGMLAAAVLVTTVLATLTLPGGILASALAVQPLRWLGSRSLGIYLWHYPLFRLMGIGQDPTGWWAATLAVALTLVLAELSHHIKTIASQIRTGAEPAKGLLATLERGPVVTASPVFAAVVALSLSGFSGGTGLPMIPDQVIESQDATTDAQEPSGGQTAAEGESGADATETAEADAAADTDEAATGEGLSSDEGAHEGAATQSPTSDDADDTDDTQSVAADQPTSDEAATTIDTSSYPSPHVLIIGNSFTFFNDMPSMLSEDLGTTVVSMTKGSAKLSEHLNGETQQGAATLAAIDGGPWDFVVIQEMSTLPIDDKERYLADLTTMVNLIRERGATPIIYGTWAYDTGKWGAAAHGMTVPEMHDALQASFFEASELTGTPIANVGQAFADTGFDPSLYDDDGKHPSEAGSQLAAEVIAETIWENGGEQ